MTNKTITEDQKLKLAQRLSELPEEKQTLFRATLEKEGIDPWQLPIVHLPQKQIEPLSFSQQRLWFVEQMEPGNPMYNIFFALRIEGELDIHAFQKSINTIIKRHCVLRTNYVNKEGKSSQVIRDYAPLVITHVDNFQPEDLDKLIKEEANKPFDLENDSHMLRVTLVHRKNQLVDEESEIIGLFTFHHISFDALSSVIFINELNHGYELACNNSSEIEGTHAEDENLQYIDFARWQNAWSESKEFTRQAEYWQQKLLDSKPLLNQATQFKRPETTTYQGDMTSLTLSNSLSEKLQSLAKTEGATLYMVLMAGFNILLNRYSGETDISVGTSIANRPKPELAQLLGFFVNTLVIRNHLNLTASYSEFLQSVAETTTSAFSNQDLPFDQLLDRLNVERENNVSPLFQVLFVLNNAFDDLSLKLGDVKLSLYPTPLYYSRFDLTLRVTDNSTLSQTDGIRLDMEFNTSLYSKAMVDTILRQYQYLLQQIVESPDQSLSCFHVLSKDEINSFTHPKQVFKPSNVAVDTEIPVHGLFEHYAKISPNAQALVYEEQSYSYLELNKMANQCAHHLLEQGIKPQQRVGILLDRSDKFIVSVLAILKAGAVYVPLDIQWPKPRIDAIASDADFSLIIADQASAHLLSDSDRKTLLLDDITSQLQAQNCNNPERVIAKTNGAYVIYTSGSTGEAKGVLVEHQHLSHYLKNVVARLDSHGKSFGLISTIAADLGNTSLFGALCFGGCLHVISSERAKDAIALSDYFSNNSVDILKIVPSHMRGLITALEAGTDGDPHPLQALIPNVALILGGEACSQALVNQLLRIKPDCRIINHYGPTETTVGALTYEYRPDSDSQRELNHDCLPIGTPFSCNRIYIVDAHGHLCPTGVVGELLISGPTVARGYLNREELTAQRFIKNDFSYEHEHDFQVSYRTGDRVRLLSTGEIEFIGRIDNQVKIRGYRVELGEIDSILRSINGVDDAIVVVIKNNLEQQQLVAYVVVNKQTSLQSVKQQMTQLVTDYMNPQRFVQLDTLPLTSNGKVDRKNLPDPENPVDSGQSVVAPRNEKETLLAAIWCDVLRIESVSVDANFFELGGDSILSLQIIARAKKAGLKITPKQLFEHKTIANVASVTELSTSLQDHKSVAQQTLASTIDATEFNLTPIQTWFFEANHPEQNHWNQSAIFKLNKPLIFDALTLTLNAIIWHHDALRMRFTRSDENPVNQYYNPEIDQQICEKIQLPDIPDWQAWLNQKATEYQQSLDINLGPLLKVCYFESADHTHDHLLIIVHHLVIDGVSWRILLSDFQQAYKNAVKLIQSKPNINIIDCDHRALITAEKTTSVKRWADYLTQYANGDTIHSELDYWQTTQSVGKLPCKKKANNTLASVDKVTCELSAKLTQQLLQTLPSIFRTQINDVLLSALSTVMAQLTHSNWVLIEVEGHGRESINNDIDLSQTIGWFTSRYPIYLDVSAKTRIETLKSIKEQLRAVPNGGIGYGLLRYLRTNNSSELNDALVARQQSPITFNYLGQFDADIEEQTFFTLADVGVGQERALSSNRHTYLDVNAYVRDDKLFLEWSYNRDIHDADMISQLAQNYLAELTEIITDCKKQSNGGVTPSDVPLTSLSQLQLDQLDLPWRNVDSVYPLTPMQEGLLFHTLMNPGTGIYVMQYHYEINTSINHTTFIDAWSCVVDRHDVLRTSFIRQEDSALQAVHKKVASPVTIFDWRELSVADQAKKLSCWQAEQVKNGFDLSIPTQMAITLIQVDDNKYHLIRSFHHILMDAWCFSLLMMDFINYYRAMVEGKSIDISPPRPFKDYIAWLQQQDINATQTYWRKQLRGFTAPTPFTIEKKTDGQGVKDIVEYLTQGETQKLTALAQRLQVTLNTFVQGAWALLLSRYSGNEDVVYGVTVAGRPTELDGADSVIGLFINTLPLRVNVDPKHAVSSYLTSIFQTNLDMREHEYAPLVDVQRWSELPPGEGLFNSLFVFENAPIDPEMLEKVSIFKAKETENRTHTNYPITVVVFPGDELGLQLTYDQSMFDEQSITRMMAHFKLALLAIGEHAEKECLGDSAMVKHVEILPQYEQKLQLIDWNDTYTDYPREKCWQELFAEQVQQTPDSIAASYQGKNITYQALYDRSQCLARVLIESGVKANDIVAILDTRGIDLLTMITGILFSGAAYLPLDPNHPEKRLASIIELSQSTVILAGNEFLSVLDSSVSLLDKKSSTALTILSIESILNTEINSDPVIKDFALNYRTDDLAYVIYTSGSTGTPKGAMVEHLGMLNNQFSKIPTLSLTASDTIAQTASQCFDISVWQFLTGLLCGAKIEIYPDEIVRHPAGLLNAIEKDGVTILESVPSVIQGFLDSPAALTKLRWLMPTGEALSKDLATRWLLQYPNIPLLNAYGPAECADDVAMWPITSGDTFEDPMPIGRPTDNNRLYVLNSHYQLQPIGVAGELYVAGAGVGRGYLHDNERTHNAFIANPLLDHSLYTQYPHALDRFDNKNRFYRTGDIARWREDGVLEYLGRTDHQVKIRGFRIELGEIEACIDANINIRRAAVVVQKDVRGEDSLVAFYEPVLVNQRLPDKPAIELLEQELKIQLSAALPAYMQPTLLIALELLPLNNNGKINRKALPKADINSQSNTADQASFAHPTTDTEHALIPIWQQVLKIENIDIHASFFELGGHSLLAAQLHARVCRHFDIDLPLRTLFERNSVAQVAEQVDLLILAASLKNATENPTLNDSSEVEMEEFEL